MMTFKDLQDEIKRRATRDQGGTQFESAIKNAINAALFRIAREAPWRQLRKTTTFDTVTSYTTGSGTAVMTSGSAFATVSTANFLTANISPNRKVKCSASGTYYYIKAVTGATSLLLDQTYYGSTTTACTYEIYPQEEYNLPIQACHRLFMWHEAFGYPYKMAYITDQDFFGHGTYVTTKDSGPTHYRMWGEDMSYASLKTASVITISSSDNNDTSIEITVFGKVSGYPDYETIITNATSGTGNVSGSKVFDSVERVVKNKETDGRITCTANSTSTTVAILPVGDTTAGILYKKIQLYPLPNNVFPIHVQYYKDPYRLVNDNDVHELGQEFDEAIILLAVSKIKGESEIAQGTTTFYSFFQDELRSLKKYNIDKIDWFPTLKRPREMQGDLSVVANLLYRQAGSAFGPASRR